MPKKKKAPSHAPRKKDQRKRATSSKRRVSRPQKRTILSKASRKQSRKRALRPVVRPRPVTPLAADTLTRLKSALQLVRQHVKGYSAADGWAVRELGTISRGRHATLLKKAATLKELLNQPHDLIRAPTKKARRNLFQFTRQKIRNAKHYIVHKPADNFDVRLRRGRVVIRGRFEGKVRGKRRSKVITESAFYLFPQSVKHPDDAERMLRDLLPDMPEGYYVMLTGAHGDTGEPVDKGQLLNRLQSYIQSYQFAFTNIYDRDNKLVGRKETDSQFAQAIAGFRLLSTTVDGMELQMQARDIRRQRTAELNERRRKEQMSKKELAEYEAPRKAEAQRQAKRKAAQKGIATRRAKARKAAAKHK